MRKDDIYRVKLIESSSPLSTRTATPFRVAGLVVMQKEACYSEAEIRPVGDSYSRVSVSPVAKVYQSECDLTLGGEYFEVKVGEEVYVNINHGKNTYDEESKKITYGGSEITSDREGISINIVGMGVSVVPNEEGIFNITVASKYTDICEVCVAAFTVSATSNEEGE